MSFEKIYVLDTNIILNDAHNIEILSDNGKNLIILPETVIDELDTKKTGFEEINFQAREFGRLIESAEVLNTIKVEKDNVVIMEVSIKDNIIIHITSFKEYGIDIKEHSILNDRKIIKVAQFSTEYYETFIKNIFRKTRNAWDLELSKYCNENKGKEITIGIKSREIGL